MSQTHSAEDVELLARELMGWRPLADGERYDTPGTYVVMPGIHESPKLLLWSALALTGDGRRGAAVPWNPFTDANADVLVLERVRKVWRVRAREDGLIQFLAGIRRTWRNRDKEAWNIHDPDFPVWEAVEAQYVTGDYARAALAVLRSEQP